MAVKIKLKRMGKIRKPQYRIVVADARTKRDGKAIEEIGKYHPLEEPSFIEVDSERAQYWLSVGAQPTDPVHRILRLTGDWQQFKGLPAPPPLKVAAPKPDKDAEFQAVLKELVLPGSDDAKGAKKSEKSDKGAKGGAAKPAKAEAAKTEAAKTEAKAEAAKTEAKAEAAKTEAKAEEAADSQDSGASQDTEDAGAKGEG